MWSDRQREVIDHVMDPDARTVLVSGPVQSGKSLSSVPAFLGWMSGFLSGRDGLLCSLSQRQWDGAIKKYAHRFAEAMGWQFSRHGEPWVLPALDGGANRFYPLLGSDASAADRARSFSANGALIDEATLVPDDFRAAVGDRLSGSPSKQVLITNPGGPMHPLKLQVLDRAAETGPIRHVKFSLLDNPALTEEYIADLHARYTGGQYQRMVLGEWAASEGLVWPNFPDAVVADPPAGEPDERILGVDWAHSSVTHCVLLARHGPVWTVTDEWVWDGAASGQLDEWEQARRVGEWLAGRVPARVWVDPSATGMAVALGEVLAGSRVMAAENDIEHGVQMVRMMIDDGRLRVWGDGCRELVRQAMQWQWDPRFAARGDDRPTDVMDHGPDALRYACFSEARSRGPRIFKRQEPRREYGY